MFNVPVTIRTKTLDLNPALLGLYIALSLMSLIHAIVLRAFIWGLDRWM